MLSQVFPRTLKKFFSSLSLLNVSVMEIVLSFVEFFLSNINFDSPTIFYNSTISILDLFFHIETDTHLKDKAH